MYQPLHQRVRGLSIYTNTPPRSAQRAPGGLQAVSMMAPLMHKAAKQLNLDPLDLIRINAPAGQRNSAGHVRACKATCRARSYGRRPIRGRGIRLAGDAGQERSTERIQGDRYRCRAERVCRRGVRHGRPVDDPAGWEGLHPAGDREPRDGVGVRHGAGRDGGAPDRLGPGGGDSGATRASTCPGARFRPAP